MRIEKLFEKNKDIREFFENAIREKYLVSYITNIFIMRSL